MISQESRIQLTPERIVMPKDIAEFDEESISNNSDKLRRLWGRPPGLTLGTVLVATIPIPPFAFGVKFKVWLIASCHLVRHYEEVIMDIVSININWGTIIRNLQ